MKTIGEERTKIQSELSALKVKYNDSRKLISEQKVQIEAMDARLKKSNEANAKLMVKVLRTFPTLVFRLRTPRSDSSLNVYNKRMMNFNDNCAKPMLNDQNRQLRLQADVAQSCKETSVFVLPTDLRRRQPPVKLAPVRLYDSPIVPRFVTSHRQPFHL